MRSVTRIGLLFLCLGSVVLGQVRSIEKRRRQALSQSEVGRQIAQSHIGLEGVAFSAANSGWTVGSSGPVDHEIPFVAHWDGISWKGVTIPASNSRAFLKSVTANANTVWAVGMEETTPDVFSGLVIRWDGKRWQTQVPPQVQGSSVVLTSVVFVASREVVVAGMYLRTTGAGGFVGHLRGSSWDIQLIPEPQGAIADLVTAIGGSSLKDIWVASNVSGEVGNQQYVRSRLLHWDGQKWKESSIPQPDGLLLGIGVISRMDIWAVGSDDHTLATHWNGKTWSEVVPAQAGHNDELCSLSGLATNDIWAAGSTLLGTGTLIDHWDGLRWTRSNFNVQGELHSIAEVSNSDVWAVGHRESDGLIVHWDGKNWQTVPFSFTIGTK